MHRIPRHGARDVVFFQHGVLDTSLGWVANGSVGSSAFAAYDAGFDCWLANARSNPPRLHRGARARPRCHLRPPGVRCAGTLAATVGRQQAASTPQRSPMGV